MNKLKTPKESVVKARTIYELLMVAKENGGSVVVMDEDKTLWRIERLDLEND